MKRPIVTVIAGPNGAGKTSLQSTNYNQKNITIFAIIYYF